MDYLFEAVRMPLLPHEILVYELIGSRIKSAREREKMSQQKLANAIGLTRASVVNMEAGRQHASVHILWRIARELGLEIHFLLPSALDLEEETRPVHLEPIHVAQIEEAANGDVRTRRALTAFISQSKMEGTKNHG